MDKELLKDYLKTNSPSTYEVDAQRLWKIIASRYADDVTSDVYGNTVAIVRGTNSNGYKVVLDAHCDEIGWMVADVTPDGFLRIRRNGGTDNEITKASNVKIMTENNGNIKGIFGTTPIHLKDREGTPKKITEDELYIDVFATSDEEVMKMGIEVGNYVVIDRIPELVDDKYVVGKSLDDKIGGFIHLEVLKRLKEGGIQLPYDLYVVNSVQEEVGLRGATMITNTIKPDVAICFDVHFDTNTPGIDVNKHWNTKIGDGILFRNGKDVHPNLLKLMKQVAKDNEFNYKIIVGGSGGTNTHAYNLSNGGVVTSTISIPLRYMHTPNEIVSLNDIETSIDYYIQLLIKIENKHNFNLINL